MKRFLFALLFIRSVSIGLSADQIDERGLPIVPYTQVGVSEYRLLQNTENAFAYSVGAEWQFCRWFSLDMGYMDFGQVQTPYVEAGGLIDFTPDVSMRDHRTAAYALPTFTLLPTKRLTLGVGIGPAFVKTRSRSNGHLFSSVDVSRSVRHERETELMVKANLTYRISESLSLLISATHIKSDGIDYGLPVATGEQDSFRTLSVLAGIRYHGSNSKQVYASSDAQWTFDAGPVFSRISYHANWTVYPIGYDLVIRRRSATGFTFEIGTTEYGTASEQPKYADGMPLSTPPYSNAAVKGIRNDLQVDIACTYAMVGFDYRATDRWSFSLGGGIAYTYSAFYAPQIVYPGKNVRYNKEITSWNAITQARVRFQVTENVDFSVGVRYHDFSGPQITHPNFEPEFGNTVVRVWSINPSWSLRF